MFNVLIVCGTRPEIIKLAPLHHALRESSWANVQWLHTAQHGGMAQQLLESFDIQPDTMTIFPRSRPMAHSATP